MSERTEALMRIVVGIISGVVLYVWAYLIGVLVVINFVWTLISGKRLKEVAELCEIWNTQKYDYIRYMEFLDNKRPFPFENLRKSLEKFSRK